MRIMAFTFNAFQENTYVLYDQSKECVIIDPGCSNSPEQKQLTAFIGEHNLKPVLLLNTHTHIDHVLGNTFVKDTYNVPVVMHLLDMPILKSQPVFAQQYGLRLDALPEPDRFVEVGDEITFGQTALDVLFTPGHSPGSISFYNRVDKVVIVGDVLFYNSIGRTDFPLCSYNDLMHSITKTLFALPDDTKVYSGHGQATTIGHEKRNNPFILEYLEQAKL